MADDKAVALEYLKLARVEILDKTKFVNQTLGAYLAGVAALGSWFYEAMYKPAPNNVSSLTEPEKMLATAAFAVMISYLAFAVSWIIYTNERLITALAIYQRCDLRKVLGNNPPMWESSDALNSFDDLPKVLRMVQVEERIVLAPPLVALICACGWMGFAYWKVGLAKWWPYGLPAVVMLLLALLANWKTIRVGGKLRENARRTRSPEADASRPVGEAVTTGHVVASK